MTCFAPARLFDIRAEQRSLRPGVYYNTPSRSTRTTLTPMRRFAESYYVATSMGWAEAPVPIL